MYEFFVDGSSFSRNASFIFFGEMHGQRNMSRPIFTGPQVKRD